MKKIVTILLILILIIQFPMQTTAVESNTYPTYKDSSGNIVMENDYLKVSVDRWVRMTITDKRTGEVWDTDGFNESPMTYETNKVTISGLTFGTSVFNAQIELLPDKPEIECTVLSAKNFEDGCSFPSHVNVDKNTEVLLPLGEGILLPASTTDIPEGGYDCWGGGNATLPLCGLIRNNSSYLQIVNTVADAAIAYGNSLTRDGLFNTSIVWKSQKHELGYQRKTTFVFFDSPSIVPMAKRFREDVEMLGYVKTFKEKSQDVPDIDKFVGAISVWIMENEETDIKLLNDFSKYGIVNYVYNEMGWYEQNSLLAKYLIQNNKFAGCSYSYTIISESEDEYCNLPLELHNAWPNDLVRGENGEMIPSGVTWRNSHTYLLGWLCPACVSKWQKIVEPQVPDYYSVIYLDGLGAQSAAECYDSNHSTTRTESIKYVEEYTSYYHENGKVLEGEGCAYTLVPYVDSAEHIATYNFCRIPVNADNPFYRIYNPSVYALKYGQGQQYRIPFWELVFHDCIATMPFWSDTSCNYPDYWYKRDLFAILYGNSMNYPLEYNFFQQYLPEFVASYNRITTVARAVGYAEMTNFVYLTEDRNVQMTEYSNGAKIIVNFGDTPYTSIDGSVIGANSYRTIGIGTTDLTYTHLTPNSSKVTLNSKTLSFDAYTINGNNYFKLRDIAYSFNSTGSPFNVTWDGVNNAIKIVTDTKYVIAGGEMTTPSGLSPRMGYQTNSVIYINGQKVELTAYCINGNNYVKLRDLGTALGFGVNWNGATSTIEITA